MNKLYSVHDHWTDINKKNDVDIESIDGVITGIKVNGEDYGGGGESDFSTARVHIVCTIPDNYIGFRGNILDRESGNYFLHAIMPSGTHWLYDTDIEGPFDESIDIMMLESYFEFVTSADAMNVTGNATVSFDEDTGWTATVTGDCTITISQATPQ